MRSVSGASPLLLELYVNAPRHFALPTASSIKQKRRRVGKYVVDEVARSASLFHFKFITTKERFDIKEEGASI
jgi:hypothetical protein